MKNLIIYIKKSRINGINQFLDSGTWDSPFCSVDVLPQGLFQ